VVVIFVPSLDDIVISGLLGTTVIRRLTAAGFEVVEEAAGGVTRIVLRKDGKELAETSAEEARKIVAEAGESCGGPLVKTVEAPVKTVGDDVKPWLGEFEIKRSDDTSFVALSKDGKRRFRMDFDGHGDRPHAHLETFDGRRWRDAGGQHRFPFKEE
jgi:hypothetical protein